ncbi:MAG: hypothetical protein JST17_09670 [Bacteroidetes bacterium]|nr:hypothetical protein [Bacteroidota bacterium]MBS1929974.1 hypothetical protein [Bacteroidota bacterium]
MKKITNSTCLKNCSSKKRFVTSGGLKQGVITFILCLFSSVFSLGFLQSQAKHQVKLINKSDVSRLPLLMPDNFDSLQLVSWRQEEGIPDSKNPLLEPAMPWDAGGVMAHGTVLHDPLDGLWKAWQVSTPAEKEIKGLKATHELQRRITYLESKDGVSWYRPKLNFVKWPGYDRTNILFDLNSGGTAVYASVLVDVNNKEWPYEMFLIRNPSLGPDSTHVGHLPAPSPEKRGIYRYRSKDGKDWKLFSGPLLPLGRGGDVAYIYRETDGSYLAYFKQYSKESGDRIIPYDNNSQQLVRRIGRSTSVDGNTWETPKIVFGRDWRDPGFAQYMELCPLHVDGGFIGMLTYYDASNKTISLQMAASRDGVHWWRPDRRPALANPPLGDYGGGMMWQMHHPIVQDGKMYVYYGGAQGLHGEIFDTRSQPRLEVGNETVSAVPTPTLPFNSALCRASWEIDRLYALAPSAGGPTIGRALTKLENSGKKHLAVNVLVKKGGELRAELIDKNGNAVPGFTAKDCQPITGDHRLVYLKWKGGDHAPQSTVRIRFVLQNAFLYGYAWKE